MRFTRAAWIGLALASAPIGIAGAQETPPPQPPPLPPPATVPETPVAEPGQVGSLVNESSRVAASAAAFWGTLEGAEVDDTDPALGYELNAAYRLFGPLSLWGGFATSTHTVEGQVLRLLDQHVRPDRRSGNVTGEISSRRLRAGARLDAMREPGVRLVPYFAAAVDWATTEMRIEKVDGADPQPIPSPSGPAVHLSSVEQSEIGGLARCGAEWRLAGGLRVDANVTYEILEFPAGTIASLQVGGGLCYRP